MTRTQKLLTIFPDAEVESLGYPVICPAQMITGYHEEDECRQIPCMICIREFWKAPYQESSKG